jgi:hypothetical protein
MIECSCEFVRRAFGAAAWTSGDARRARRAIIVQIGILPSGRDKTFYALNAAILGWLARPRGDRDAPAAEAVPSSTAKVDMHDTIVASHPRHDVRGWS